MKTLNNMGFYPTEEALDHDTEIFLHEALSQLVASDVHHDVALESMRRVLSKLSA